jgi:hypothetical protein
MFDSDISSASVRKFVYALLSVLELDLVLMSWLDRLSLFRDNMIERRGQVISNPASY